MFFVLVSMAWAQPASSTCITGSNGAVACGWDCKVGSNGVAVCSNVPWGSCAVGSDGKTVCLQGELRPFDNDPSPSACTRGSNGQIACGWDCRVGSDGVARCADTPGGSCAVGSNGQTVCSRFDMHQMSRFGFPQAMCRTGSDGAVACGFACVAGSDGKAACSPHPSGSCAVGSDGRAVCFGG